ncbi:sel1 repeat family protein [PVC group bacterium]|nr:sel1 repeat family protein [PVC group bacterium]
MKSLNCFTYLFLFSCLLAGAADKTDDAVIGWGASGEEVWNEYVNNYNQIWMKSKSTVEYVSDLIAHRKLTAEELREAKVKLKRTKILAKAGNVRQQNKLGELYFEGKIVSLSYRSAFKWWSMAAEKNDPFAMNQLGMLYFWGRGIVRNYRKAADLFAKSANRQHAPAMLNLAVMYARGHHFVADQDIATMWADRGAKGVTRGDTGRDPEPSAEAQFYYAQRLALGEGIDEPDRYEAYRWASSAAALADGSSKRQRSLRESARSLCTALEGVLDKKDILTAQSLAGRKFKKTENRATVKVFGPGQ